MLACDVACVGLHIIQMATLSNTLTINLRMSLPGIQAHHCLEVPELLCLRYLLVCSVLSRSVQYYFLLISEAYACSVQLSDPSVIRNASFVHHSCIVIC